MKSKSQKGFTLVEVIIAMIILSGSLIMLANAWSGNLLKVRKANYYNTAGLLLQRKLTETDLKFRGRSLSEIPDEEKGDFGNDYKNYRWSLRSKEFEFPDLTSAMISQDGGANELMITMVKQLGENISKAIKEVTVSVYVKVKKKEVEYSVTTYFVDYSTLN